MKTKHFLVNVVLLAVLALAGCTPKPVLRVSELQTGSQSVELGGARSVSVKIKMGAGDLKVNGGAEKLLEADFAYNVAELRPEVKFTGETLVIWEPGNEGQIDWRGITEFRNEWSLHFNNDVPMNLSLEMGAGTSNLQLAGLSLTGLDVTLGAGTSTLDLSGNWAHDLDVAIDTGAADVTVILPRDVGVRVEVDRGPTVIDAPDMKQDGDVYTNEVFGTSGVILHVNMQTGIGRVHLKLVDAHAQAQAALHNLLAEQVETQSIPGMVMAVRLADGTVIWDTAGYTSPSGHERWSADTESLIASVTKTFTAVVVMQLVEEEKLSLDDTVDTWFPKQPDGDKITVRMLLSHTSGLADYQNTFGTDAKKWTRKWTPDELIAEANQAGPVGEPGSSPAHYSNTNYIMLGLIIEKVTGNGWEQEVASRIVKPLGLNNTSFMQEGVWNHEVVPGYIKTSDGYQSLLEYSWYSKVSPSTAWAAGGIVSSAADLMTFASALFGGRLVSNETLAIMTQPVATGDGRTWALGGAVVEVNGYKVFGMGGDTTGYHAFFAGAPGSKFIVTALVNAEEGNVISPSMTALQFISQ